MSLFEKFKKKSDEKENSIILKEEKDNNIIETTNYMLVDVKKDFDFMTTKKVAINSLQNLGSGVAQLAPTIETITNRTVNQNEWIKASFWNAFTQLSKPISLALLTVWNLQNDRQIP